MTHDEGIAREGIVKRNLSKYITGFTLLAALVSATRLTAQVRYKVVDMGTFGGPQGFFTEQVQIINDQGTVAGYLDTATGPKLSQFR